MTQMTRILRCGAQLFSATRISVIFVFVLVIYTLCVTSALHPSNFNFFLVTPLFKKARLVLQLYLFKLFLIVPLYSKSKTMRLVDLSNHRQRQSITICSKTYHHSNTGFFLSQPLCQQNIYLLSYQCIMSLEVSGKNMPVWSAPYIVLGVTPFSSHIYWVVPAQDEKNYLVDITVTH